MSITIRTLIETDIEPLVRNYCGPWTTPEKTLELWKTRYQEQLEGTRTVGIVESNNSIAGYGSLVRNSEYFKAIPEINDLWIGDDYRGKGFATQLIAYLENLAISEGFSKIGLGVGLYKDYGPAQRLYYKLGFCPDGNGVTYRIESVKPGNTYPIDDELILWLIKDLN